MGELWCIPDGRTFKVNDRYYLASCDGCGWVGSSEDCSTCEADDVYCPICHRSGADCGSLAKRGVQMKDTPNG